MRPYQRARHVVRLTARRAWRAWCTFWVERERPARAIPAGPACVKYTAETTPHRLHHVVLWVATDSVDEALAVMAGGCV
jgi:hypothetical protein